MQARQESADRLRAVRPELDDIISIWTHKKT